MGRIADNYYNKLLKGKLASRACPGVYAIFVDGQIAYIGKSENMLKRLSEHIEG